MVGSNTTRVIIFEWRDAPRTLPVCGTNLTTLYWWCELHIFCSFIGWQWHDLHLSCIVSCVSDAPSSPLDPARSVPICVVPPRELLHVSRLSVVSFPDFAPHKTHETWVETRVNGASGVVVFRHVAPPCFSWQLSWHFWWRFSCFAWHSATSHHLTMCVWCLQWRPCRQLKWPYFAKRRWKNCSSRSCQTGDSGQRTSSTSQRIRYRLSSAKKSISRSNNAATAHTQSHSLHTYTHTHMYTRRTVLKFVGGVVGVTRWRTLRRIPCIVSSGTHSQKYAN
jgi:hypothetical protein